MQLSELIKQRNSFIYIEELKRYRRCRVQTNAKGIVLRDELLGFEIKTKKQQLCKAGDFVVAEIDAKVGGYGLLPPSLENSIVSSHYYLFDINQDKLIPEYLEFLLKTSLFRNQVKAEGSTNYASIRPSDILKIDLPIPTLKDQRIIVKKIKSILLNINSVTQSITTKLDLISKIRQSILQEAIQGKLVPQDPNAEPASELLKRIKAEKEKLIAEGKIKKEKPLPPISSDEVPFELPKGWEWSRLGNLGYTQTGSTPPTSDSSFYGDHIEFVGPADIRRNLMTKSLKGLSKKGLAKGRLIVKNSVIMVCIGGSIGKCAICDRDISCNQQINSITPLNNVNTSLVFYILQSQLFQNKVLEDSKGSATPIINKNKWEQILSPLSPITEQKRIVDKVDILMKLCDELEEKLKQSKENAEKLMQAVLNEVFGGAT